MKSIYLASTVAGGVLLLASLTGGGAGPAVQKSPPSSIHSPSAPAHSCGETANHSDHYCRQEPQPPQSFSIRELGQTAEGRLRFEVTVDDVAPSEVRLSVDEDESVVVSLESRAQEPGSNKVVEELIVDASDELPGSVTLQAEFLNSDGAVWLRQSETIKYNQPASSAEAELTAIRIQRPNGAYLVQHVSAERAADLVARGLAEVGEAAPVARTAMEAQGAEIDAGGDEGPAMEVYQ